MLEVFWDAELAPGGVPASEFFDEHGKQIVSSVSELSGFDAPTVADVLNDYRYVADFHSLVVADGHLAESISRFAIVLLAKLNE